MSGVLAHSPRSLYRDRRDPHWGVSSSKRLPDRATPVKTPKTFSTTIQSWKRDKRERDEAQKNPARRSRNELNASLQDLTLKGALMTLKVAHVRMTETLSDPMILTTDSDFRIYRRHSRQVVPCVMPS
jgi:hypothetical protein